MSASATLKSNASTTAPHEDAATTTNTTSHSCSGGGGGGVETGSSLIERTMPAHSTLPKTPSTSVNRQKSATLAPSSGNHPCSRDPGEGGNDSNLSQHFAKNNFRRSFTLPRSLLLRKNGGLAASGTTTSENDGNFIRNLFLSFMKSKGNGRRGGKRQGQGETTNGEGDSIPLGDAPSVNGQPHNSSPPDQSLGLPPGFVPAAVGLKNQGNTCFMNAIVQCLSHTDVLAKYLVTDSYKSDLRRKYWIKSGKGEVTEELASILKSTWFRLNSSALEDAASRFKAAVEKGNSQYRGSEQHDAQEFLLWLLDRLHEDLNQAASNKYKPVKNNFGRPDEQVAAEALSNHLRCNNSIIHEIFGAQFRSSLTCPGCKRQSATFDPFNCVSLPIPQGKAEVPIYVNIVYLAQQPRLVKLGLSLSSSADVRELKQLLSVDTGVAENDIILAEIDGEGFHRTFTESLPVSVLSTNDAIYCIETPEQKEVNEDDGAFLMITWANILVTTEGGARVRFGSPYISQIARETGWVDLQKLLLKEMAPIVQPGVLISEQKEPLFTIRVLDGSVEGSEVDPSVEHPLYMESVDHALSLCDEDVPPHVKIHLEWTPENKEKIIADDTESMQEHSSVAQTRVKHSEEAVSTVTLGECFDVYTKAEQLSAEDSWHCPHCNRKEQGTLKMIGLWTAPQILVVHLKRFRQATKLRQAATKISSVVDFPLEGLDLDPHVSKRSRGMDGASMDLLNHDTPPINGCFGLGSWKHRASFKKHLLSSRPNGWINSANAVQNGGSDDGHSSLIYDLFAVCNHHGKDVQGGHYTAYCKNPVDNSWWAFDDTRVTQLATPADVKTASAYILFYQRRVPWCSTLPPAPSIANHWCRTLLKKHHKRPGLPIPKEKPQLEVTPNPNPSPVPPSDPELQKGTEVNGEGEKGGPPHSDPESENHGSGSVPVSQQNGYHLHPPPEHPYQNGYDVPKEPCRKGSSGAPLARMEDMACAITLGMSSEIQIESTV